MAATLSSTETYSLLSLALACFGVLFNTFWDGSGEPLIASIAFSSLAFAVCYALIRWLGNAFMRRGFKGKDLCKHKQTEMYANRACMCSH
jgi:UDP-N-acetylglucosamine--dolichyl-phosphate N-acetylglucosaminephosphotransferase